MRDTIRPEELSSDALPWKNRLSERFYGGRVIQKTVVTAGEQVEFAGHWIFVWRNEIHSRILNPNVTVQIGQPDCWNLSRYRFQSGREPTTVRAQLGRAYGHLIRVLDHTTPRSRAWVLGDMFFVLLELYISNWRLSVLKQAVAKVSHESVGLKRECTVLECILSCLPPSLRT